ncbi:MAG: hypothetical protein HYV97_02530 [Bdellovibrio sp.]|nr:hypothetical protein [Bdellovibrio sp.]
MVEDCYDRHWKRDWIGEWYPIFRSLGEQTDMIFTKCSQTGQIKDVYYLDHGLYDGSGALEILTLQNQTPGISQRVKKNPRPIFLKQILGLLQYLRDTKVRSILWKKRLHDIAGKKTTTPHVYVMSIEQTKDLIERARFERVSLSMFILKYVDEMVRTHLQFPEARNIWLVPVNMRGSIKRCNPLSNHYSYLAVKANPQVSMTELDKQYKKAFDYGYHWAAWWGLLIGKFIGLQGMRNIINKYHAKKHSWTGVLSNMGVWGAPNSSDVWAASAPVTRTHPIGVAFMTWNDQLSITLHIHPSLDSEGTIAPALLNSLRDNL